MMPVAAGSPAFNRDDLTEIERAMLLAGFSLAPPLVPQDRTFDGALLRKARVAAGFSLEQAAITARRSVFTVRAYETGAVEPPVNVLARLGALMQCPIDRFLTPPFDWRKARPSLKQDATTAEKIQA